MRFIEFAVIVVGVLGAGYIIKMQKEMDKAFANNAYIDANNIYNVKANIKKTIFSKSVNGYQLVDNNFVTNNGYLGDYFKSKILSNETLIKNNSRGNLVVFGSENYFPYSTPSKGENAKYLHFKYTGKMNGNGSLTEPCSVFIMNAVPGWRAVYLNGKEITNTFDNINTNDSISKSEAESICEEENLYDAEFTLVDK